MKDCLQTSRTNTGTSNQHWAQSTYSLTLMLLNIHRFHECNCTCLKFFHLHCSVGAFANYNQMENRLTDFIPTMTDMGVCSTFNAPLLSDVFVERSVSEFHEVFLNSLNSTNRNLASADIKEYTFIIDSQARRHYPFKSTGSRTLARYSNLLFEVDPRNQF